MISEESLARLTIAWEACQLSDAARTSVRLDGDPGELLARAHEVLQAAERYAAVVHAYTCQQTVTHEAAWWHGNPEELAADLDDWLARHRDGEDLGPEPISRALK